VETTLPLPCLLGLGRSILLKSTSPSCLGELRLKRVAGLLEYLFGEGVPFRRRGAWDMAERNSRVDADAGLLHAQEDRDEREVHGAVEMKERMRGGWRSRSLRCAAG